MAKNKITDYSQVASENTDLGGTSILGTAPPRNLRLAQAEQMKQLADVNKGTAPLDDTFTLRDPSDTTKAFRFDGGNIPTSTTRAIDAESLYDLSQVATDIVDVASRRGAPTLTYYTTAGAHTHTFSTDSASFQIFAIGGGGAGGNVDSGGALSGGSASGGNSGFWGSTIVLTKGAIATGTIAIGAGGTVSAVNGGNGGDGGNTTWSDGTNSFTWPGGKGGIGVGGASSYPFSVPTTNTAPTGTLYGAYEQGSPGITSADSVVSPAGGGTPYGQGIIGSRLTSSGVANGQTGGGYGSGGGGGARIGSSGASGGAGRLGMMIVVEW